MKLSDFRDFEKTTVRVRYADTDRMGVVYHANYFEYFETGRADFIRRIWKPYAELEKEGLILPVIEAGCRYYKSAEYDDVLTVCTRVENFTDARLCFHYSIFKSAEIHSLAEGFTVHCFMNLQGKLRRIPSPLRRILEDLQTGIRT